jgi:(1->4)-alpha-D-glucan 1-alpha-D-glucosylmutase
VGFARAAGIVPYLDALGITDLYLSPVLAARTGSTHGYDVVDPTRLDPRLGSPEDFDALADALRSHGMGLLLDIVPNHMAMSEEDEWWTDVLRHGRASRYARFFDVDWETPALPGRILAPILGRPYGEALEAGELRLSLEDGKLALAYFERRLPLDPATIGPVLERAVDDAGDVADELQRILRDVARIPPRTRTGTASVARRVALSERVAGRLRTVAATTTGGRALGRAVASFGPDRLDALVAEQAYLPSFWRAASKEIDYRRFFDISDLVSMRMSEAAVFEATHRLVLDLVRAGKLTGLRVDHVDGLADPEAYLATLRDATGGAFVVVEKILARDESLPAGWVVGTTGYEFIAAVDPLFVDPRGRERLERWYVEATGVAGPFREVVRDAKRALARELFAGELDALARTVQGLGRQDRHGRDLTHADLLDALVEVAAALPVYRTYVRSRDVSAADRRSIEHAVGEARLAVAPEQASAVAFVHRVLTMSLPERASPSRVRAWLAVVTRWQQFTGPLMAKGAEDTALYRWLPLLSLDEVGGDPGAPPVDVARFHALMRSRARGWTPSLSAGSTHDTKRSEDVRARIDVLSEMPERWIELVERWGRRHEGFRTEVNGAPAPDRNEELFLYQTLVGTWPVASRIDRAYADRVAALLRKALREAKVHSDWLNPDERYEQAVERFARAVLSSSNRSFRTDLAKAMRVIALHGALNSVSQALLRATAPGIPDVYQGTELLRFDLVDPDNRRPVDFKRRAELLAELDRAAERDNETLLHDLLENWPDGRFKLFVLSRALRLRRSGPELFERGSYVPLAVTGPQRDRVVAFARRWRRGWAVVVVPRLTVTIGPERLPLGERAWSTTSLRIKGLSGPLTDVFTGRTLDGPLANGRVPLATLFERVPVWLGATGRANP